MIVNGLCGHLDPGTTAVAFRDMAAEPHKIVHDVRERGVASGITRAEFPVGGWAANDCFLGKGGQAVRGPADAVTVAREHLVGRDGIAIDAIGSEVNVAMAGMLDAVDDDETLRRLLADGGGNGHDINRDAGDGRSLNDGRNPNLGCNVLAVGIDIHGSRHVIMGHENMRPAGHFGPARHGAARCGVFQRAAQHDAAGFRSQCRGSHQTEQHFGSAFADEDLA